MGRRTELALLHLCPHPRHNMFPKINHTNIIIVFYAFSHNPIKPSSCTLDSGCFPQLHWLGLVCQHLKPEIGEEVYVVVSRGLTYRQSLNDTVQADPG